MMEATQVLDFSLDDSGLTEEEHTIEQVAVLQVGQKEYPIYRGENKIGRDTTTCKVVLENKALSKEHAVIQVISENNHCLWDLGSTNKTRLGKMILTPHVRYCLLGGETLTFADVICSYRKGTRKVIPESDDTASDIESDSLLETWEAEEGTGSGTSTPGAGKDEQGDTKQKPRILVPDTPGSGEAESDSKGRTSLDSSLILSSQNVAPPAVKSPERDITSVAESPSLSQVTKVPELDGSSFIEATQEPDSSGCVEKTGSQSAETEPETPATPGQAGDEPVKSPAKDRDDSAAPAEEDEKEETSLTEEELEELEEDSSVSDGENIGQCVLSEKEKSHKGDLLSSGQSGSVADDILDQPTQPYLTDDKIFEASAQKLSAGGFESSDTDTKGVLDIPTQPNTDEDSDDIFIMPTQPVTESCFKIPTQPVKVSKVVKKNVHIFDEPTMQYDDSLLNAQTQPFSLSEQQHSPTEDKNPEEDENIKEECTQKFDDDIFDIPTQVYVEDMRPDTDGASTSEQQSLGEQERMLESLRECDDDDSSMLVAPTQSFLSAKTSAMGDGNAPIKEISKKVSQIELVHSEMEVDDDISNMQTQPVTESLMIHDEQTKSEHSQSDLQLEQEVGKDLENSDDDDDEDIFIAAEEKEEKDHQDSDDDDICVASEEEMGKDQKVSDADNEDICIAAEEEEGKDKKGSDDDDIFIAAEEKLGKEKKDSDSDGEGICVAPEEEIGKDLKDSDEDDNICVAAEQETGKDKKDSDVDDEDICVTAEEELGKDLKDSDDFDDDICIAPTQPWIEPEAKVSSSDDLPAESGPCDGDEDDDETQAFDLGEVTGYEPQAISPEVAVVHQENEKEHNLGEERYPEHTVVDRIPGSDRSPDAKHEELDTLVTDDTEDNEATVPYEVPPSQDSDAASVKSDTLLGDLGGTDDDFTAAPTQPWPSDKEASGNDVEGSDAESEKSVTLLEEERIATVSDAESEKSVTLLEEGETGIATVSDAESEKSVTLLEEGTTGIATVPGSTTSDLETCIEVADESHGLGHSPTQTGKDEADDFTSAPTQLWSSDEEKLLTNEELSDVQCEKSEPVMVETSVDDATVPYDVEDYQELDSSRTEVSFPVQPLKEDTESDDDFTSAPTQPWPESPEKLSTGEDDLAEELAQSKALQSVLGVGNETVSTEPAAGEETADLGTSDSAAQLLIETEDDDDFTAAPTQPWPGTQENPVTIEDDDAEADDSETLLQKMSSADVSLSPNAEQLQLRTGVSTSDIAALAPTQDLLEDEECDFFNAPTQEFPEQGKSSEEEEIFFKETRTQEHTKSEGENKNETKDDDETQEFLFDVSLSSEAKGAEQVEIEDQLEVTTERKVEEKEREVKAESDNDSEELETLLVSVQEDVSAGDRENVKPKAESAVAVQKQKETVSAETGEVSELQLSTPSVGHKEEKNHLVCDAEVVGEEELKTGDKGEELIINGESIITHQETHFVEKTVAPCIETTSRILHRSKKVPRGMDRLLKISTEKSETTGLQGTKIQDSKEEQSGSMAESQEITAESICKSPVSGELEDLVPVPSETPDILSTLDKSESSALPSHERRRGNSRSSTNVSKVPETKSDVAAAKCSSRRQARRPSVTKDKSKVVSEGAEVVKTSDKVDDDVGKRKSVTTTSTTKKTVPVEAEYKSKKGRSPNVSIGAKKNNRDTREIGRASTKDVSKPAATSLPQHFEKKKQKMAKKKEQKPQRATRRAMVLQTEEADAEKKTDRDRFTLGEKQTSLVSSESSKGPQKLKQRNKVQKNDRSMDSEQVTDRQKGEKEAKKLVDSGRKRGRGSQEMATKEVNKAVGRRGSETGSPGNRISLNRKIRGQKEETKKEQIVAVVRGKRKRDAEGTEKDMVEPPAKRNKGMQKVPVDNVKRTSGKIQMKIGTVQSKEQTQSVVEMKTKRKRQEEVQDVAEPKIKRTRGRQSSESDRKIATQDDKEMFEEVSGSQKRGNKKLTAETKMDTRVKDEYSRGIGRRRGQRMVLGATESRMQETEEESQKKSTRTVVKAEEKHKKQTERETGNDKRSRRSRELISSPGDATVQSSKQEVNVKDWKPGEEKVRGKRILRGAQEEGMSGDGVKTLEIETARRGKRISTQNITTEKSVDEVNESVDTKATRRGGRRSSNKVDKSKEELTEEMSESPRLTRRTNLPRTKNDKKMEVVEGSTKKTSEQESCREESEICGPRRASIRGKNKSKSCSYRESSGTESSTETSDSSVILTRRGKEVKITSRNRNKEELKQKQAKPVIKNEASTEQQQGTELKLWAGKRKTGENVSEVDSMVSRKRGRSGGMKEKETNVVEDDKEEGNKQSKRNTKWGQQSEQSQAASERSETRGSVTPVLTPVRTSRRSTPQTASPASQTMSSPRTSSAWTRASLGSPFSQRQSQTRANLKVMFTGYDDPQDEKTVQDLGGILVDDTSNCTVLVTDKVRRTCKFLCMMGKGVPIVTPDWLTQSKQASTFLDPWNFIVDDREAEKKFNFKLQTSLASASRGQLLTGYVVTVTPGVQPPPEHMKEIVECAGGTYSRTLPARPGVDKCFMISCPKDKKHWSKARKMGVPVVGAEILLSGILKYKLELNAYKLQ